MQRDNEYLQDILESARIALKYLGNKARSEFENDTECQDAILRRLEIIGEAARRISEQTKLALPQVPWKEMTNARNLIIHEYDGVDISVIWETLQRDIPHLVQLLENHTK